MAKDLDWADVEADARRMRDEQSAGQAVYEVWMCPDGADADDDASWLVVGDGATREEAIREGERHAAGSINLFVVGEVATGRVIWHNAQS